MVSKRLSRLEGHRRKFLAVIDDTPECERAVRYAGRARAAIPMAGSSCSTSSADGDFQHWLGVEEIMRAEAREEAEAILAKAAAERARDDRHRAGTGDPRGQGRPRRSTR